ncbi:hypothetical protein KIK84_04060 [Curvibacter sp. CHRR-16]|uniref:hypothetical protein n=1 Tax=Curvibacter sp. CHRR-16 TaxID=2835872 RepID=UPI001BDB6327|nr:hypothetical protein [Curvibacter sp. CHRR-16]MBT0569487.1 hypothetical protein [Curvibacter sp. CHRR-16]
MSVNSETLVYHYEARERFLLWVGKANICPETGVPLLPANATFVPPPILATQDDEIAQFDKALNQWRIVPNNFWRPLCEEVNYDAGRLMATYQPLSLSAFGSDFPNYPSIPQICNSRVVVIAICQRIRFIQEKFNTACLLHKAIGRESLSLVPLDSPDAASLACLPTDIYRYKLEIESIVYLMRRVLDSLAQLTYLITDADMFQKTKKIAHNEIGRALDVSTQGTDFSRVIVGDGERYEKDSTEFLKIINELFNSFKHSLMHDESYTLIGEENPTIVTYHAKHNDHNSKIVFHNHSAHHIMMGFQDTVLRILSNQKVFVPYVVAKI